MEKLDAFFINKTIFIIRFIEDRIEVIIIWDGRQDPRRLQNLLIDFLTKQ